MFLRCNFKLKLLLFTLINILSFFYTRVNPYPVDYFNILEINIPNTIAPMFSAVEIITLVLREAKDWLICGSSLVRISSTFLAKSATAFSKTVSLYLVVLLLSDIHFASSLPPGDTLCRAGS